MKKQVITYIGLLGMTLTAVSCNDFLDSEPIAEVTTKVYLHKEGDLAAYSAKLYDDNDILPSHGSATYNLGLFRLDNGTDNQTSNTPSKLFVKGQYHVSEDNTNLWKSYMTKIRSTNYFLERVPDYLEQGQIKGNSTNIKHYIGEMYFFRAYIYYMALRDFGDFPIVKNELDDDYNNVREASRRRPRNEVARFILEDLDNAYNLMSKVPPMSNRLTKDCAALLKSRVALFEGTWEKYHKGTAFVPGGNGWQAQVLTI